MALGLTWAWMGVSGGAGVTRLATLVAFAEAWAGSSAGPDVLLVLGMVTLKKKVKLVGVLGLNQSNPRIPRLGKQ